MQNLLEEFYKTDINHEKYHQRKISLDAKSYEIIGITQSGKTKLVKNYLLGLKKSTYLYIDCDDVRIEVDELNKFLQEFCTKNKIDTLVLDNYFKDIKIVNVSQLIIISQTKQNIDFLIPLRVLPLDYEEFLVYEHKYDSSALNHFFKLGGFPSMHKIYLDDRVTYIQKTLKNSLSDIEFDILKFCAKNMAQKISPFSIYERLRSNRKISKDKTYEAFKSLIDKNYIHILEKKITQKPLRRYTFVIYH
jgi:predicted AAA+ superfamily ATPase